MAHTISVIEASRPRDLSAAAAALDAEIDHLSALVAIQRGALEAMTTAWQAEPATAAQHQGAAAIAAQEALLTRLVSLRAALAHGGHELDGTRTAVVHVVGALRDSGWQVTDTGIAVPPPWLPSVLRRLAPRFTVLIRRLLSLFTDIDARTADDVRAAAHIEPR